MKRLESHVEAIVGPLRASEGRKDRIREELLDHLELAREESRDRGTSDATAAALERFGSIDAVRAEIQGVVPAWERCLWTPVRALAGLDALFEHEPERDRTPLRYAARRTVLVTSMVGFLLAVVVAVDTVLVPPPGGVGWKVDILAGALCALASATFLTFYALERTGIRAKLDLRDPCSASAWLLSTALMIAVFVGSVLTAAQVFLGDGRSWVEVWQPVMDWVASWSFSSSAILLGALGLVLRFAWKEASETKKRYARWGTTPRIPAE